MQRRCFLVLMILILIISSCNFLDDFYGKRISFKSGYVTEELIYFVDDQNWVFGTDGSLWVYETEYDDSVSEWKKVEGWKGTYSYDPKTFELTTIELEDWNGAEYVAVPDRVVEKYQALFLENKILRSDYQENSRIGVYVWKEEESSFWYDTYTKTTYDGIEEGALIKERIFIEKKVLFEKNRAGDSICEFYGSRERYLEDQNTIASGNRLRKKYFYKDSNDVTFKSSNYSLNAIFRLFGEKSWSYSGWNEKWNPEPSYMLGSEVVPCNLFCKNKALVITSAVVPN